MKKLMTLLALLCCLAMVMCMVACQTPDQGDGNDGGNDGEGDGAGEGTGEGENNTPVGDALQMFNEDGSFRYTIIRSDSAAKQVRDAMVELRENLAQVTGLPMNKIELKDDWVHRDTTAEEITTWYEILLGDTDRPESKQAMADLTGAFDYKIEVIGNKIVIVGGSDLVTLRAAQYFIKTYLTDPKLTQISTTLSYKGVYEPLPLEVVLEDKSTGRTHPRVVETKYATDDVVIADIIPTEDGYAVSNNGYGDCTAGIQKALNDCAKAGGGTVYLPAGDYILTGKITIPAFVTLRGDWQDPDVGTEYGTVFHLYVPSEDNTLEGTIWLGGSGGVVGLTVYYPEQSLDAVKPYPFTFYTDGVGDRYMLSTVKNVTVINGYRGIGACLLEKDLPAHEQLTIENFKGTFLSCGAEVYNQADVGTWQDVTISLKYWTEAAGKTMVKADAAKLEAYAKANTIGLKLGDLEWTEFESLKIDGCKVGIQIMKGRRIEFAGSLLDIEIKNCGTGLLVTALDSRWGMVIARSVIEGGIINQTGGLVKLCDVKVTGPMEGSIANDTVSSLADMEIDYLRTYVKPTAKLYLVNGLDKTGKLDMTAIVQAALNQAGKTGGIVYLPAGRYRFDGCLTVPAGVELRGSSSVATRDQGGNSNGTLLLCYYGIGDNYDETSQAFITLAGDYAGINGIRIAYPSNGPLSENLMTSYTVRGQGKGVYMVNGAIIASAYGVDFRNCDEHFIKKVTTCCYYNTFRLGGKNGMLSGCLQNGTVIQRHSIPNVENWIGGDNLYSHLFDPILRQQSKYILLDGATDQQIYNTFAYGCATLITCNNSTALVANIGSDNIGATTAQLVMNSGKMTVVNSMRWNGHSYDHNGGTLAMYNRLTINDKNEQTSVLNK